jgi:hypothetical protein
MVAVTLVDRAVRGQEKSRAGGVGHDDSELRTGQQTDTWIVKDSDLVLHFVTMGFSAQNSGCCAVVTADYATRC